jgi:hypothetical protein
LLISTVNSRSKKIEKKPVLSCASSGYITKLKQSIFGLSISMVSMRDYYIKENKRESKIENRNYQYRSYLEKLLDKGVIVSLCKLKG